MKDCFEKIHEQTLKIVYNLFLGKIKKKKNGKKKKHQRHKNMCENLDM